MTQPELYANVIAATGWTIDQVGDLTLRQINDIYPPLCRALAGEDAGPNGGMDYMEAVRRAGVEDRVKGKSVTI